MIRFAVAVLMLSGAAAGFAAETNVPADAVVATINGKKFTAAQITQLLETAPFPQARTLYKKDPTQFLKALGVLMIFSDIALAEGLDKQSPYKEMLEFNRQQLLTQIALDHQRTKYTPTPDEQAAYYKAHEQDFRQAKVRMIYFPFSDEKSEAAAKEKAAKVVGQARLGADFVQLAKANSEDPTGAGADFVVKPDSAQPPPAMKSAILRSKAGTVTDAMRHDNGYYVFRVETVEVLPYAKVKDDIYNKMQDEHFRVWQNQTQQKVNVQIQNEAFFKNSGQ